MNVTAQRKTQLREVTNLACTAAPEAMRTLTSLMVSSEHDMVRLKAAEAILKRVERHLDRVMEEAATAKPLADMTREELVEYALTLANAAKVRTITVDNSKHLHLPSDK